MTNRDEIARKLDKHMASFLIDGPAKGSSPEYQRARRQIVNAKKLPEFASKRERAVFALTELHIFINDRGEFDAERRLRR